jgi:ankyrin repeat protein
MNWLMIVDSIDELEEFDARQFLPLCSHGAILVTSTHSGLAKAWDIPSIEISEIDKVSGVELLLDGIDAQCHSTEGKWYVPHTSLVTERWNFTDRKEAEKIVEALDSVPLAIEQAAAFLSMGTSIYEFRGFYANNYERLMKDKPYRSKWYYDKNRSVFNTFEMLHEKLAKEDNNAPRILMLASLFGPGEIPTRYFAKLDTLKGKLVESEGCKTTSRLRQANLILELARWFEALTNDQLTFRRAIARLEEWCLCKIRKNNEGVAISFLVHNAIRRWSMERMQRDDIQPSGIFAAFVLSRHLKDVGSCVDTPMPNSCFAKHIHSCLTMIHETMDRESVTPPDGYLCHQYGHIAARFAQYYLESRRHAEAETMLEAAIEYEMALQGSRWPSDKRSLDLIEALGSAYWHSGNLEKAEGAFSALLGNSTMLLGDTDEFTVRVATQLRCLRDKLITSRSAADRATVASRRPKQNTALAPTSWGPPPEYFDVEIRESEYQREEYRLREIALQMKMEFGERDKDTLEAINNLGTFYEKHDNFDAAITQFEQLWHDLPISERRWLSLTSLRIPCPDLRLQALHSLARCYQNIGKLPEALQHTFRFTMALAVCKNYRPLLDFLLKQAVDLEARDDHGTRILHLAALNGRKDIVKLLLDRGAEIEAKDKDELTALHCAARKGHEAVVKLLLDRGAEVEVKDKYEWTALHHAARNGQEAVVKLLLDRGAEIEAKSEGEWTALHHAAWNGQEAVVKLLLDREAEIEVKDKGKLTALHCAGWEGQEAVVKLLLDRGAEIEAKDKYGWTVLHCAAWYGQEAVVKLLLDRGAGIEAKSKDEWTALHRAAWNGQEAVVKLLLDRGAEIEAKDKDELTALHYAAWNGQEAVVKLLLDRGAEIEAKDKVKWTALHCAAENGQEAVVKLLLDRGAETEAKDKVKWTALHRAAGNGQEAVVKLLLDRGAEIEAKGKGEWTALHGAACNGQEAVVKLLLDRGAGIEAKSKDEWTALHCAAENGQEAVVKLLLDRGAEIEAKDKDEWTAVHGAACNGQEAVVKLLLDRGAEIEAKSKDEWTALHCAAENGQEAVVKLLLDRGAEIEAKDKDEWTALHRAAWNGQEAVVKLLLDRGAEIEAKDKDEWTALHRAAWNGQEAVVKLLLNRGAGIEAKDKYEWTALHRAAWNGQEAVVKLLLDRGAEIEAKDKDEWTALHCAARNGQEAVVKLLLDRRAEIEANNKGEQTALRLAAENGHEAVVKLLLDHSTKVQRCG